MVFSPQSLPCALLLGFAFGFYIFHKLEALEMLMVSLGFSLQIMAMLSCSCLFDAIVELHAMNEKWKTIFSFQSGIYI